MILRVGFLFAFWFLLVLLVEVRRVDNHGTWPGRKGKGKKGKLRDEGDARRSWLCEGSYLVSLYPVIKIFSVMTFNFPVSVILTVDSIVSFFFDYAFYG